MRNIIFALSANFLYLTLFISSNVMAGEWASTESFESSTGNYSAEFVRDSNKYTQIRFVGDFTTYTEDGSLIQGPRAAVTRELYKNHADNYDMLFVLSDFNYEMADDVAAFNLGIRNQIQGIRKNLYDNGDDFGSEERLSSYIEMHSINDWDLDPLSNGYQSVLNTAMHEIMHQWVIGVRASFKGNSQSNILIGQKGSHWSALLDNNASVMFGHEWTGSGDKQFTATEQGKRYSALDMYLAGFYSKNEVPPFRVIETQDVSPESTNLKGRQVTGTQAWLTIDDVVAAEGKRIPESEHSQKAFKARIIFLTSDFEQPDSRTQYQLNQFAKHISTQFSLFTGGRATLDVINARKDSDNNDEGSEKEFLETINIDLSLNWLLDQQHSNGAWSFGRSTQFRDSYKANELLLKTDEEYRSQEYDSWVSNRIVPANNDDLSIAVLDGKRFHIANILDHKAIDGGWGFAKGDGASIYDTVRVLSRLPALLDEENLTFLTETQNSDGGWPLTAGGVSHFSMTTNINNLLNRVSLGNSLSIIDTLLNSSQNYLRLYTTLNVENFSVIELSKILVLPNILLEGVRARVLERLVKLQLSNGSWNNQIFDTAIAADALLSVNTVDLFLNNINLNRTRIIAGEPIVVSVDVMNIGSSRADNVVVKAYLSSAASEVIAEEIVSELGVNEKRKITFKIDSLKLTGNNRVIIEVDPEEVFIELTRDNNIIYSDFVVSSSKESADIAIFSSDVSVTPSAFNTFTEAVKLSAKVRNLSMIDINQAKVSVWKGNGQPEELVAVKSLDVTAASYTNVQFDFTTEYIPELFVKIESPSDTDTYNNIAKIYLQREDVVDLSIENIAFEQNSLFLVGEDVTVFVEIKNNGTTAVTGAIVELVLDQGDELISLKSQVDLIAGSSRVLEFSYRLRKSGRHELTAKIDSDNLIVESNESNNSAKIGITVHTEEGINWHLAPGEVFISDALYEGSKAIFRVPIVNNGSQRSPATLISMYSGNPDQGGELIGQAHVLEMESEERIEILIETNTLILKGKKDFFAVIDNNNQHEEVNENDNSAFSSFFVESLPDLYISTDLIKLNPNIVMKNTSVEVSGKVVNLGGQDAKDVVVQVYLNDAEVYSEKIPHLSSFEIDEFYLQIPAENLSSSGRYQLTVELDKDNSISESNEVNNIAEVFFNVGDGELFVSERYISPNGDGVQDDADISAVLKENEIIRIINSKSIAVIEYSSDISMPLSWAGEDESQHKVADGVYRIQVISMSGVVAAEQVITVDVNETSPMDYGADDVTITANFVEKFGKISWRKNYDNGNRYLFLKLPDYPVNKIIPGLYTADYLGNDLSLIATHDQLPIDPYEYGFSSFIASNKFIIERYKRSYGPGDHDDSYYLIDLDSHTYFKTDLISTTGNVQVSENKVVGNSKFHSNDNRHYLTGVFSGELQLFSIDVVSGVFEEITTQSDCNSGSWYGHFEGRKTNFIKPSIYAFNNCVVDFVNEKIYKFDHPVSDYDERTAALIDDAENLLLVDSKGIEQFKFNIRDYYDSRLNSSKIVATRVALDIKRSKVMLYTRGEGFYAREPDFSDTIEKLKNSDYDLIEGMGYRIELDVDGDKVSLKNYNLPMVGDYRGGYSNDEGGFFDWDVELETYLESLKIHDIYQQDGISLTFNGFEAGEYLPSGEFYDKSYYFIKNKTASGLSLRGLTPSFIKTFLYDQGEEQVTPILYRSNLHLDNKYTNTYTTKGTRNKPTDLIKVLDLQSYMTLKASETNVEISVLATDVNFKSYSLEYSLNNAEWLPIISEDRPRYYESVITWSPPYEGSYRLRLTSRDKSGNVRRQIDSLVWSEGAYISETQAVNLFFSPNYDDIKETFNIQFKVLRPTNVLFRVESSEGILVKEDVLAYDEINSNQVWQWDGRDLEGDVSPDGMYKVTINDTAYTVVLDTTFPVLTIKVNMPDRLVDIDYGNLEPESIGIAIGIDTRAEFTTCIINSSFCSIRNADDLKYQKFRLMKNVRGAFNVSVTDYAGNKTELKTLENLLNKKIRIERLLQENPTYFSIAAGFKQSQAPYIHRGLPTGYPLNSDSGYVMPGLVIKEIDFGGEIQLAYIDDAVTNYQLGYVSVALGTDIENIGDDEYIYSNIFIPSDETIFDTQKIEVSEIIKYATDFDFLTGNDKYLFLYADAGNERVRTNLIRYEKGEEVSYDIKYVGGDQIQFKISSLIGTFDNEVIIRSLNSDSPYYSGILAYASEQEERIEFDSNVSIFTKLSSCQQYEVEVRLFIKGKWNSHVTTINTNCLDSDLSFLPLDTSGDVSCGVSKTISMEYSYKNTPSENVENELSQKVENIAVYLQSPKDLIKKYIVSESAPKPTGDAVKTYRNDFLIDKSTLKNDEGYQFFIELTLDDGQILVYKNKIIGFDNYMPVIEISAPSMNEKVCAVKQKLYSLNDETHVVDIKGSVVDYGLLGDSYIFPFLASTDFVSKYQPLEMKLRGNVSHLSSEESCSAFSSFYNALTDPKAECRKIRNNVTVITDGERTGYYSLGTLNKIEVEHGENRVDYFSYDISGNTSCGVLEFIADTRVELTDQKITAVTLGDYSNKNESFPMYGVSPNGDEVFDEFRFSYRMLENADLVIKLDGVTILEKHSQAGVGNIILESEFNGIKDGTYLLTMNFKDDCGFEKIISQYLVIDRSPPEVIIHSPQPDDELFAITGVIGTVSDPYIQSYRLELQSQNGSVYTLKNEEINQNYISRTLHNLNLSTLSGEYTLRLWAQDKIGNKAEHIQVIQVGELGQLLTDYSLVHEYISPKSDGLQSNLLGLLTLTSKSKVILKHGEDLLADLGELSAGTHSWAIEKNMLSEFPDGRYDLTISAIEKTEGGAKEELGELSFYIDNVFPLYRASEDSGGAGLITGLFVDINVNSIAYQLQDEDDNVVYASFVTEFTNPETMLSLNLPVLGLNEAHYRFSYIVTDLAGNEFQDEYEFTYDVTSPVFELSSELKHDIIVNPSSDVVLLKLSYREENLRYIDVLIEDHVIQRFINFEDDNSFESIIDWGALKDGKYHPRIVLSDHNGNTTEKVLNIVIDRAAPIITFSKEGYVRPKDVIRISTSDLSALSGKIQIAGQIEKEFSAISDFIEVQWPSYLVDGDHLLTVNVSDAAGNITRVEREYYQDSEKPDAPEVVSVHSEADSGIAAITWSTSRSDDVVSYALYRNGIEMGIVENTSYLDRTIGKGEYDYYVLAIDHAGNQSSKSPISRLDLLAPDIRITLPLKESILRNNTEFYGSVVADDLLIYQVYLIHNGEEILLTESSITGINVNFGHWDSEGSEGLVTLKVVAEDHSKNIQEVRVNYSVDNIPLSIPQNFTAEVVGNNIVTTWESIFSDEIVHYQVWRSAKPISSAMLSKTTYIDQHPGDGIFQYSVVSVDTAGNISPPSNSITLTLDQHSPEIIVQSPQEGERFENTLTVLIVSNDKDIAEVVVQLIDSAGVITRIKEFEDAPFTTYFDTENLDLASYSLKITATDIHANKSIKTLPLIKSDMTPPQAPSLVEINTVGEGLLVSWVASESNDIDHYQVVLTTGNTQQIKTTKNLMVDFNNIQEGSYVASIRAFDTSDNSSIIIQSPAHIVIKPDIDFPYSPTGSTNSIIKVDVPYSGSISIEEGNIQIFSDNIESSQETPIDIPLLINDGSHIFQVSGVAANGESMLPSVFKIVKGDQLLAPLVPEILSVNPQAHIEVAYSGVLANGEYWFPKVNGALVFSQKPYEPAAVSWNKSLGLPLGTGEWHSKNSQQHWFGGFLSHVAVGSAIIKKVKAWNGVNWMLVPFENTKHQGMAAVRFLHPVHTNALKVYIESEDDSAIVYWTPLGIDLYEKSESILVPFLTAYSTERVSLSATNISVENIIGAESNTVEVEQQSNEDLPSIILSANHNEGSSFLEFFTTPEIFTQFILLVDSGSDYVEVVENESGQYRYDLANTAPGHHSYKVIGITEEGHFQESNYVDVILTPSAPSAVIGLTGRYDSITLSNTLQWQAAAEGVSYQVYRKQLLEVDFSKIAIVTDLTWKDLDVTSGTRYRYRIVTEGSDGSKSTPSDELILDTGRIEIVQPVILAPETGLVTTSVITNFILDSHPGLQININNNDILASSYLATSDFTALPLRYESQSVIDLGRSSRVIEAYGTYWINPLTGTEIESIKSYAGTKLRRLASKDVYILNGAELTKVESNSEIKKWNDVKDFEVSGNGAYLVYMTNSILLAEHLETGEPVLVNLSEELNSNSVSIRLSADGVMLSMLSEAKLTLYRLNNSGYEFVTGIDLSGLILTHDWINDNRILIETTDKIYIYNSASEIVAEYLKQANQSTLNYVGYYANKLILGSVDSITDEKILHVYSTLSGRHLYQSYSPVNPINALITAFGQICGSETLSSQNNQCHFMPGVDLISLEVPHISNRYDARVIVFNANSIESSEPVVVNRMIENTSNANLESTLITRAMGVQSDIKVKVKHIYGKAVEVTSVHAEITRPDGSIIYALYSGDAFDISALSNPEENIELYWIPDQVGEHKIKVSFSANDDEVVDNSVISKTRVSMQGVPDLGIDFDLANQQLSVELNTGSWSGQGSIILSWNNDQLSDQAVLRFGSFDSLTDEEYSHSLPFSPWLESGFNATASLVSVNGDIVRQVSLSIQGELPSFENSSIQLLSKSISVEEQSNVEINYRITGNTSLWFSGTARISVISSEGQTTEIDLIPHQYILNGEMVENSVNVAPGTLSAGRYAVNIELIEQDGTTISSDAGVLIIEQSPVRYQGDLSLVEKNVGMNDSFVINVEVSASSSDTPQEVSIKLLFEDSFIELTKLSSNSLPYRSEFIVEGYSSQLGEFPIQLIVENVDDQRVKGLDELKYKVIDIVPPAITIVTPSNNSLIKSNGRITVMALDAHSGIDTVNLVVDDADALKMNRSNENQYDLLLNNLTEGQHQIYAIAYDIAGNRNITETINVSVDNIAPVLTLVGAETGQFYDHGITLIAAANDEHLQSVVLTVNGIEQSGLEVEVSADGLYNVQGIAKDEAGNIVVNTLSFVIDQTAPVILVEGVSDGALYNTAIDYRVSVNDENLANVSVQNSTEEIDAEGKINSNGQHRIHVIAQDLAGNTNESEVIFRIDTIAPNVPTINFADGQNVDLAMVTLQGNTEQGSSVILTINGSDLNADVSGENYSLAVPLNEGINIVNRYAIDAAGNQSLVETINLIVATSPDIDLVVKPVINSHLLVWAPWYSTLHDDKAEKIKQKLDQISIAYQIETSEQGFRKALRSQQYNVVLMLNSSHVLGLPTGFSFGLSAELRGMVANGLGLITIADSINLFDVWNDVYGLSNSKSDVNGDHVSISEAGYGEIELTLSGRASRLYVDQDAYPIGNLEVECRTWFGCRSIQRGSYPGLVYHQFLKGKVVTVPFNIMSAVPENTAMSLLENIIYKVTPDHLVEHFPRHEFSVIAQADTGETDNISTVLTFDESQIEVRNGLTSELIFSGVMIDAYQLELTVQLLSNENNVLTIDALYRGEVVGTETVELKRSSTHVEKDWEALSSYAESLSVPWYQYIEYLLMKGKIRDAQAIPLTNSENIHASRNKLLLAMIKAKTLESDSETMSALAGKLLLRMQFLENN